MITVTKSEVKVHDLEKGKNLFKFWVMTKKIGNGKSYLLGTSLGVGAITKGKKANNLALGHKLKK